MSFNPQYFFPTIITNITSLNGGLYGTVKATDVYPAVDIADVTQSPQGTTKPYQIIALFNYILSNLGDVTYAPVLAASTVNLMATYNNGVGGIGATLTNSGAFGAFTLDGQTGVLQGRYLIKNQLSPAQNGIYTLTTLGDSTSVNWVLTRSIDFNQSANILEDGIVYVLYGTTNGTTFWQDSFTSPITVGTTAINWATWMPSGASSGTVDAGLENELAYYATNGDTVNGLPTANNGVLVTSNTGVPSISTILPAGLTIPGYSTSVLPSGDIFVGNASNVAVAVPMSGDATLANTGAITVTKTNGVPFAASATIDTTDASNITSGNLSVNRLNSGSGASGSTFWRGDGTWALAPDNSPWQAGAGTGSAIDFNGSTAAGSYAVAYGQNNVASTSYSVAFGNTCTAGGSNSFSFGSHCTTNNGYSWAIGNTATAHNQGSVVWGDHNSTPVSDGGADQFNLTFGGGYNFYINNTPTTALAINSSGVITTMTTLNPVIKYADSHSILDNNGNNLLTFQVQSSAVNYVVIENNSTTNNPQIYSAGSDTNIILQLNGKGTGGVTIQGRSDGSSVNIGYVGEIISSKIVAASAVNLTSTMPADVTSINVTAGNWKIFGNVSFLCGAGSTPSSCSSWSSITSASVPDQSQYSNQSTSVASSIVLGQAIPSSTVNFTVTTTVYLSCVSNFTGTPGAVQACGQIFAERIS